MNKEILLSIIIVAYKNETVLEECLSSIVKYNDIGTNLEVIVVDNSPVDMKVDKSVKACKSLNIKYISSENRGFGAGNNEGAKIAKGKYLAFINPDIIFIKSIFRQIIYVFETNLDIAMFGGKLLDRNLKGNFSFYFDYNIKWYRNFTIKLCNKLNFFSPQTMYISGANMFIRRDIFYKIGMFDEDMFMYYEEPDITRRIYNLKQGYKICFFPQIKMIHLERASTPQSPNTIVIAWESAIVYGKKHGLNYRKKLKFEYNYYKFKYTIFKLLNNEQKKYYKELIEVLSLKFQEYL